MKTSKKPTGPRTEQGKRMSSRNAFKHGIFAKVAIPQYESRADFKLLCQGLAEICQPQGMIQWLLVEKLAMLMLRSRRLAIVERATIQEELETSEDERLHREAIALEGQIDRGETERTLLMMAFEARNPFLLDRAIELLKTLIKTLTERNGPLKWDSTLLRKIFGTVRFEGAFIPFQTIHEHLTTLRSQQPDRQGQEETEQEKEASKECVKSLKGQIEIIEITRKLLQDMLNEKRQFRLDKALLPPPQTLELLIRSETHIGRQFDRTLDQLERLQRISLGHPAPPSFKVEVTS